MKREIISIHKKKQTMEGAGVKLFRVFGNYELPQFDPFLLLDHFGSDNPDDYMKGFPWHPHRGMETVTYMLSGEVEHGDNIGNKGVIRSGDVQWMTAGSGIIHQEMPKKHKGLMQGIQLWVNLPKAKKMMQPGYQGILSSDIPSIKEGGALIKVISGKLKNITGPVKDLGVDIEYHDITLEPGKTHQISTRKDYTAFIYIIKGSAVIGDKTVDSGNCILFSDGDKIELKAKDKLHFLYISGKKIKEPIAWGGPIVMNTEAELRKAFQELSEGIFIKNITTNKKN